MEVTKLKIDSKVEYYQKFFDDNIKKSSAIWKGMRSIVNINKLKCPTKIAET